MPLLALTRHLLSKFLAVILADRFWDKKPAQLKSLSEGVEVAGEHMRSIATCGRSVLKSPAKSFKIKNISYLAYNELIN